MDTTTILSEIGIGATVLVSICGVLSQIAAIFGLDWLSKTSTTIGGMAQVLAGNYGKAKNAPPAA